MGAFWSVLARVAVKVALYAAGHPDQVHAVLTELATLRAAATKPQ
jgi:hypothetical protein